MLAEVVEMQAQRGPGPGQTGGLSSPGQAPQVFRDYVLQEHHWRIGRVIASQNAKPDDEGRTPRALNLLDGRRMNDYARPSQLSDRTVEGLDRALEAGRITPTERHRFYLVRGAMDFLRASQLEEMPALDWYHTPDRLRRPRLLHQVVRDHDVDESTWRRWRDTALQEVWKDVFRDWPLF